MAGRAQHRVVDRQPFEIRKRRGQHFGLRISQRVGTGDRQLAQCVELRQRLDDGEGQRGFRRQRARP